MKPVMCLMLLLCSTLLPAVKAAEVLVASGHAHYPPFMYRDGDQIAGVGADLTRLIFNEVGIEVVSRYVGPWERVMRKAQNGKIDLIVGAYKTKERERYLAFPREHYVEEPVVIFVNKNNAFDFDRWQDLNNKFGGTAIGESWGNAFDNYAEKHLNIQRLVHIDQSFKMISRNRLDYAIFALYPGRINLMKLGLEENIIALPKLVDAPRAYQAFAKNSQFTRYLNYYSKRIRELKQDGTVQRLIDKHMQRYEQNFTAAKLSLETTR